MIRSFFAAVLMVGVLMPVMAFAQSGSAGNGKDLPETLQNLAAKGAQIRYLGREKGLDGWIAIHQGQEQYFYATPDREAVMMGLLFDRNGKLMTIRQVQNLQDGNDPTIESLMAAENAAPADPLAALQEELQKQQTPAKPESRSEKLMASVEGSNWVSFGKNKEAPAIYAFIDPQCPHCKAFTADIRKDYLDAGVMQLRVIPIGFGEETKVQAAILIAAPNAEELWFRHLDGDQTALPVSGDANKQAVELNLALMQDWKLDATPIIVYRSAKGDVKIVRGRPKNPADILNDLKP